MAVAPTPTSFVCEATPKNRSEYVIVNADAYDTSQRNDVCPRKDACGPGAGSALGRRSEQSVMVLCKRAFDFVRS